MLNRRQLIGVGAAGAALVSTKAWSQTANMGLPEAALMDSAAPVVGAGLQSCCHAERLDPAAPHEQRCKGVPPCR